VPGPLDAERSTVLNFHNRQWRDLPLADLLSAATHAPVLLEDDATAAAFAEALVGAGAGHDPVAYLTVSSGVGAGIVVNGQPLRGARGQAGEIGHLVLDPDGPRCGCGRRGDVEAYAGGHSLARQARAAGLLRADGAGPVTSPEELFAAAVAGDLQAEEILDRAQYAIARALAVLMATLDPSRIVVGGSIALAQPEWIAAAAATACGLCHADSAAHVEVVPARLGDLSALAGAALGAAQPARSTVAGRPT
jgi:glucokinase